MADFHFTEIGRGVLAVLLIDDDFDQRVTQNLESGSVAINDEGGVFVLDQLADQAVVEKQAIAFLEILHHLGFLFLFPSHWQEEDKEPNCGQHDDHHRIEATIGGKEDIHSVHSIGLAAKSQ